jgi:hypothetical protein
MPKIAKNAKKSGLKFLPPNFDEVVADKRTQVLSVFSCMIAYKVELFNGKCLKPIHQYFLIRPAFESYQIEKRDLAWKIATTS